MNASYKRYRVKFQELVWQTEKSVLLKTWNNRADVWLPLKCIKRDYRYTKGIAYIIPEWLCNEKGLSGKEYQPYHHPQPITPQYNQEAIDELKL